MALPIDITVVKAENLDTSRATDGAKIFCLLQKSGDCFGPETKEIDPSNGMEWNEKFTFDIENPILDSILISVFGCDDTDRYKTPIGSVKIPARLAGSASTARPFDIYSYGDSQFTGTLQLIVSDRRKEKKHRLSVPSVNRMYKSKTSPKLKVEAPLEEKPAAPIESLTSEPEPEHAMSEASLLSDGSSSDMGSDSSVHRRRRRPADFVPVQGRDRWQDIDLSSLVPRDRKKHRRRKIEGGELKEAGRGSTLDKMMNDKKDRNLNAAMERLKMDPVKMKAFADYSAVMEKNKKLVKAAMTEGRWSHDGALNKPLSEVTLRSIRFAIEETKEWIEKVNKLEVSRSYWSSESGASSECGD